MVRALLDLVCSVLILCVGGRALLVRLLALVVGASILMELLDVRELHLHLCFQRKCGACASVAGNLVELMGRSSVVKMDSPLFVFLCRLYRIFNYFNLL